MSPSSPVPSARNSTRCPSRATIATPSPRISPARRSASSQPTTPRPTRACMASPRSAGVLVNVAARPELCDFTLPALLERDPVTIAIFTGGASPILGRRLRAKLEAAIPPPMAGSRDFCARCARSSPRASPIRAARRRFWESALDGAIAEFVFAGDEARARATPGERTRRASTRRASEARRGLSSSAPGRAIPIS